MGILPHFFSQKIFGDLLGLKLGRATAIGIHLPHYQRLIFCFFSPYKEFIFTLSRAKAQLLTY